MDWKNEHRFQDLKEFNESRQSWALLLPYSTILRKIEDKCIQPNLFNYMHFFEIQVCQNQVPS